MIHYGSILPHGVVQNNGSSVRILALENAETTLTVVLSECGPGYALRLHLLKNKSGGVPLSAPQRRRNTTLHFVCLPWLAEVVPNRIGSFAKYVKNQMVR